VPRFQDNRHMKLSALRTCCFPPPSPGNNFWYSFLLDAASTPGLQNLTWRHGTPVKAATKLAKHIGSAFLRWIRWAIGLSSLPMNLYANPRATICKFLRPFTLKLPGRLQLHKVMFVVMRVSESLFENALKLLPGCVPCMKF